jgi:hypothetical protein
MEIGGKASSPHMITAKLGTAKSCDADPGKPFG